MVPLPTAQDGVGGESNFILMLIAAHICSFYINLPIGGVAAGIIILIFQTPKASISETSRATPLSDKILQMDPLGFVLILGAIICFLLALQWGGTTKPWGSPDVVGTVVGFALMVILFIATEWIQGPRAMLPSDVLKRREVWSGAIFSFLLTGSFFILLYYLPIYFQAIRNTSAESSGIRSLALIIADTLTVIASGVIITKTGYFAPIIILGSIMTAVGCGLLYTLSTTSGSAFWIGYQVLTGLGVGLCFQAPIMAGQALAPPEQVSTTTAVLLCP